MAITIATLRPRSEQLGDNFALGTPDVEAAIASATRYFDHVGADVDSSALRGEYERLAGLGYSGRLYPAVGADVSFEHQLELMESVRPRGVDSLYRWDPYWTPGTEKRSPAVAELNGSDHQAGFTARLALHSSNKGEYDPLLHFRGLSFDDKYQEEGKATQLEMIELTAKQFAVAHEGCSLSAASHRDYPTWVTTDRLDKVDPRSPEFVLNTGLMRTPSLGRRAVVGGSCVGGVYSRDGLALFGWDFGRAAGIYGVGVGLVAG